MSTPVLWTMRNPTFIPTLSGLRLPLLFAQYKERRGEAVLQRCLQTAPLGSSGCFPREEQSWVIAPWGTQGIWGGAGGPVLEQTCSRRGQGKDRPRKAPRLFPALPAHRLGSPFPAIFAGFVWFAPLAPFFANVTGTRAWGERGLAGRMFGEGIGAPGLPGSQGQAGRSVLRTETLQTIKSGKAVWSSAVCGKAEGTEWSHSPEAPMPGQGRAQGNVLVALGHANPREGCAPAVTLPNQSQALGCKSTRGDSEKRNHMIKQQLSASSEELSRIISGVCVRRTVGLFATIGKDLKGNTRRLY